MVSLEARTKEYERALAKAQGTTVTALRRIERQTQRHAARQQATLARMGAGIQQTLHRSLIAPLSVFAGAAGVRAITGFADSFTRIENAMKVAGVEGDQLVGTMENLFDIASKHGAPVEALATLYGRLALVQNELNVSSEDLLSFSDNVAAALRVSGKSAAEASGALLQLSQALGSGVVRAEEFNSILEGAPAIAQAAARGLEEAGGSVAALRNLVLEGAVTSDVFFRAFQAGAVETQRQAKQAETTIGQAWENIRTAFVQSVGEIDKTTGASDALTASMEELARQVRLAADDFNELKQAGSNIVGFFQAVDDAIRQAGRDWGLADALDAELVDAKARLANYQAFRRQAEAAGNQQAIEDYERTFGALERALIATINALEPGPAFEKAGREGGVAFSKGFQQTVSLDGSTPAASDTTITGGRSVQKFTVPGANGPVPVTVTRKVDIEPAGIAAGNRDVESTLDRGFDVYDRHGSNIADHTGRTVDRLGEIGDRFEGSLGQQTSALVSAFDRGFGAIVVAGSSGSGQTFTSGLNLSVGGAEQRQIDKLARERDVIQAGLQFKQLSPQDEQAALHRLAEIDLQTAQLNQQMGEAKDALQSLKPMIAEMNSAGRSWSQITQRVAWDMKRLTGNTAIQPLPLTPQRFAGGGEVHGPGGPKSDSVPIMASAGEYVVNAASTKKHRALLDAINGGSLGRMADGGLVSRVNGAAQRLARGGMVRAAATSGGGREVHAPISITVNTPDADSFRRSSREIVRSMAAELEYEMQGR